MVDSHVARHWKRRGDGPDVALSVGTIKGGTIEPIRPSIKTSGDGAIGQQLTAQAFDLRQLGGATAPRLAEGLARSAQDAPPPVGVVRAVLGRVVAARTDLPCIGGPVPLLPGAVACGTRRCGIP